MWSIQQSVQEDQITLDCYFAGQNKLTSCNLTIIKDANRSIKFILFCRDLPTINLLKTRLSNNDKIELSAFSNETLRMNTQINENLIGFNLILTKLDETLSNFSEVLKALPSYMGFGRNVVQRTAVENQQQINAQFTSQAENTMNPMVFITARKSEMALRQEFNFPAPVYEMDYNESLPSRRIFSAFFALSDHLPRDFLNVTPITEVDSPPNLSQALDTVNQTYVEVPIPQNVVAEVDEVEEEDESDYPGDPAEHSDELHQFNDNSEEGSIDSHEFSDDDQSYDEHHDPTDHILPLETVPLLQTLFQGNLVYSPEENAAIDDLLAYLEKKRDLLTTSGHIIRCENLTFTLSPEMLLVLTKAKNGEKTKDFELAIHCMDVLVAIRAIQPTGSHSSNSDMRYTEIVGYGMRNIVALLWHCTKAAAAANPTKFCHGVSFEQSAEALIHGIADGARGKNRNEETGVDDLYFIDNQSCDKGRYNAVIAAFVGILPQVDIKYNYMEVLMLEMKQELYKILLDYTSDYTTAVGIVKNWISTSPDLTPEYVNFVALANKSSSEIQNRFLNNTFADDPSMKDKIRDELAKTIVNMQQQALGLSFIEQITLSVSELDEAWSQKYPVQDGQPVAKRIMLERALRL